MVTQPVPLSLPTDIYRLVFSHLDVTDILVLRRTCKEFFELSILRSLWDTLLQKHIISQNIPIPGLDGKSLHSLSSSELEQCYQRALALRQNWVSDSPVIHRQNTLNNGISHSHIIALNVLPGRGNRWIVSLSMTPGMNHSFTIQCWDISGTSPVCLAMREMKQFRGMAVNKVACDYAEIAVLTPELELMTIDPHSQNPHQGFQVAKASIPSVHRVHALHLFRESSFLTRDTDGLVYLWDLNSPLDRLQLQTPDMMQPRAPIDALMTDELVVVLRLTTLELYARPSEASSPNRVNVLNPISAFTWPWRVDNAVMTLTHRPGSSPGRTPIDILLRFGSYYPWPLNILHHYKIRPNSGFLTDPAIGMNEQNPPYEFPPVLLESFASPVRLHATYDMAIGPYGTAIWTDSHTEHYFNHSDRGQRVASMFSSYIINEEGDEEVALSDQMATASAATVYAYHEDDGWVRVAMDETEGRIFLGHENGLISILEYA